MKTPPLYNLKADALTDARGGRQRMALLSVQMARAGIGRCLRKVTGISVGGCKERDVLQLELEGQGWGGMDDSSCN